VPVRTRAGSSRAAARHYDALLLKPNTALLRGGTVGAVLVQV
jgi:hypothetical protein